MTLLSPGLSPLPRPVRSKPATRQERGPRPMAHPECAELPANPSDPVIAIGAVSLSELDQLSSQPNRGSRLRTAVNMDRCCRSDGVGSLKSGKTMKEAYAVRRTVPPSAEIQAEIDK